MEPQQKQNKSDKIEKSTLKIGVYLSPPDSKHPVFSNSLLITDKERTLK
jgi:hypothetical protein